MNGGSPQDKERLTERAGAFGVLLPHAPDDAEDEDFEVFYDAWQAVELFYRLQTQWVISMDGVVGLNYASVTGLVNLHEKKDKRRIELMDEIAALERGFLKAINEKRKK